MEIKRYYRTICTKDNNGKLRYYPQIRYLFFLWADIFQHPILSFKSKESAYDCIREDIKRNKIKDFDINVIDTPRETTSTRVI